MPTLITGSAGYIGSHTIIDLFENSSDDILSIDDYSNSSEQTYERIKQISTKTPKYACLDLKDYNQLQKFFSERRNIDSVIHFAAHKAVGESAVEPLKYYQNNVIGLINLLQCCKEFGVKSFIFSSSCTVYGEPKKLPVDENSPIAIPESPYGNTKKIGEEIIKDFCSSNPNFNAISLRYFNPVGAHSSGLNGELPNGTPNNLVPFITQTAIGKREKLTVYGDDYPTRDGSCIRDYIHVSDIAHAHSIALKRLQENKQKSNYEVFNLGSGNGVTVLEVIKAFEKATKVKLNYQIGPRRKGDVVQVYADRTFAEKELGWKPKYSLEEMMLSAWKWEKHISKA